ncbi:SDR family NAD(P)-dependent oxidoreductase [Leptospira langatensis]|uniref:SDR family NAD(P)-dependent oxidoreductase n=1 Tax=Leptospira langatensis TaxID=2484983 RepID=A0A5F1ZZC7_9LEPT|nr:SDR family NAD(P)-dependent oxidoreductase [Leptospira langatensis]TGJ98442.1 SDR family NAD(P)-dependent oxidoreductase [Leptospira langatensis]TGL43357.1 SDR family NAD(P)-dependent oxidoreductase [Leptospira langatensis]
MSKYYQGKKVFITGGSAGIGKGIAIALAKSGASVMICARGKSNLDATVKELKSVGSPGAVFDYVVLDVSDKKQVQAAAKKVLKTLGGLDVLICNSGYAQAGEASDLQDHAFRKLMDVNFFGHLNVALAFQDHFRAQGKGDIIFLASTLAIFSVYGYGAYSASKFAISGFAQAFRQEMMLHNVKVKLFLPPTTNTPGLEKENEDKPPISKEMEMGSSLNKVHSIESVSKAILKWIPNRKFFGYTGWDSWLQYSLFKHFPEFTLKIADSELKAAQARLKKKNGSLK